jgi:hypothetical protein
MSIVRFEKFEMKYGCYLPEDFKRFMINHGGDVQFGSCRFEYPVNIINNIIRIPGKMDFHLIPFGDVGNGDYYCFYKYGEHSEDYFVGIWLHETGNFVILASSFKGFMYKCALDDYLSTIIPNEDFSVEENILFSSESVERCENLSKEFEFNLENIKGMENENDYHKLMVKYDDKAIQSICFLGVSLINKRDIRGESYLDNATKIYPPYSAPYYLLGKAMFDIDNKKDGIDLYLKALRGSLILTGYSYWEEDFLEIPEDVHREMALLVDESLKDSKDFFERRIYNGVDPYDYEFRLELARGYVTNNNYAMAMIEYNNAIFCSENKEITKDILKEAMEKSIAGGLYFLTGLIEQDIRKFR